jgi:hypothetical protein
VPSPCGCRLVVADLGAVLCRILGNAPGPSSSLRSTEGGVFVCEALVVVGEVSNARIWPRAGSARSASGALAQADTRWPAALPCLLVPPLFESAGRPAPSILHAYKIQRPKDIASLVFFGTPWAFLSISSLPGCVRQHIRLRSGGW